MRKILMALAACALTGAVQAAPTLTVNFGTGYEGWTVWAVSFGNDKRATVLPNVTAPLVGYKSKLDFADVLEGASSSEQLTALNTARDTDYFGTWLASFKDATFSTVDADGNSSCGNHHNMYSWLFVLVEQVDDKTGSAVEGTRYAVIQAHEQGVTYDNGDYSKPTSYPDISNGYSVSSDSLVVLGGYNAIPEPTSGLLLLLGVAGLALKRRRA